MTQRAEMARQVGTEPGDLLTRKTEILAWLGRAVGAVQVEHRLVARADHMHMRRSMIIRLAATEMADRSVQ